MTIVHPITPCLFNLFKTSAGGGLDQLKKESRDYYSFGPNQPAVSIGEDIVTIEIDVPSILHQKRLFDKIKIWSCCFYEPGDIALIKLLLRRSVQGSVILFSFP
jgi:hypothetical protein